MITFPAPMHAPAQLVAKRKDSTYQPGMRSRGVAKDQAHWMAGRPDLAPLE